MLLRTILSVLVAWALLIAVLAGLLAILKRLVSIRATLEKIAMGVRAIERQTMPLDPRAENLATSLGAAGRTVAASARRMSDVDRSLDVALPTLRPQ